MATRMIRSRANWKKAWTEDEVYNQFVKDNPQYKAAPKEDVIQAYLEQRDERGAPLFEAFEKSDTPLEYINQAASSIGPDTMRYIGDTLSGLGTIAGGAVKVAAGLANPFQTPQARLQTLKAVAGGVKSVPDIAVALKDYAKNRFAGLGSAIEAANPVASPEARAESLREVSISPLLQNLRDTPVQMAGDIAGIIDLAALPVRAAPVAAAATLRSVGKRTPGLVGTAAKAASQARVLSQMNEAGQALSRVANTVDPLTAPGVVAHHVAPGKTQELRQAMAKGLYRKVLNPSKSIPRTEASAMVEEGLHKRIPISESGLGDPGARPLPPGYNSVADLISEADQIRESRALAAAQSGDTGLSHIDTAALIGTPQDPGMQGLRQLWNRLGNSDTAAAVRQKVWDEVDSAFRSWTEGSLDPAGRPVPGNAGTPEFNPDFDTAFAKWLNQPHQIPVHSQGKAIPNAVDIRKEANNTLKQYRDKRAAIGGRNVQLPEEEALSIILKDVINEPFFKKLDAVSGATGADATSSLGRQESIHIRLRDAIDNSVKAHYQAQFLQSPYYVSQGLATVGGILTGNLQLGASTVASLAVLRLLYQHSPEIASRFAIRLASKNPDPAFWRGVVNHVRMLDKATRQTQSPQESAPPVPPGSQANPAMRGDFDDGHGDFR